MKAVLQKDGKRNHERYPCIHIAFYVENEDHPLMVDRRNVGITIPDSQGGGYYKIDFCPWCGKKITGWRGLRKQN